MHSPSEQPQFDERGAKARIEQSHQELLRKVENAADAVDAEYAFETLATIQLLKLNEGYEEPKHGTIPALVELAAFHLYPRFGKSTVRDGGKIQAVVEALTEFNDFRPLQTAFSVEASDPELAAIQVHLQLFAEIVRGSACGHQFRLLIEKIQGPFDEWFRAKTGIGPMRAVEIVESFEGIVQDNFRSQAQRMRELKVRMLELKDKLERAEMGAGGELELEKAALGKEMADFLERSATALPCSFGQFATKIPNLTREEWNGLRDLIGLTPESRGSVQNPRDIKDRPLYFLSGDRFFFLGTSVYDALFDAYDRVTRSDLPFRDKVYVPNLSAWMEGEVCDYLRRLFPSSAVYRQVTYPDPEKPGGETELDAAVLWGPFLVVAEVKGRQFRARSRLGDPARLRDDLRDNIEEAFQQATRAMRYIGENAIATFTEKETGRKLVIRRDALRRVFPISVTLHHFGGLTTQLALLKKIGLFKDSAYPWSVSLPDLDIITKFAGSPDVFLHYVQRRLDLQRSEKNVHGDELDLFGLYLDTRLHPSVFWERKEEDGREFTMLHLGGGSERFDAWFDVEHSGRGKKPDIRLDLPPRFAAVIEALRGGTDDGARWIAFALLGLSQPAIDKIEADLQKLREIAPPAGKYSRVTFKDGELVVSVIAGRGCSAEELHRQTASRVILEKYRLRGSASLAFGIELLDSSQPFAFAIWIEGPWAHDAKLEESLKNERPRLFTGKKLPGRNDPCVCGSGLKFKNCCMAKIELVPADAPRDGS